MAPVGLALALCGALLPGAWAGLMGTDDADCDAAGESPGAVRTQTVPTRVSSGGTVPTRGSSMSDEEGPFVMIGDAPCVEGSMRIKYDSQGKRVRPDQFAAVGPEFYWKDLRKLWGVAENWLQNGLEGTDIGKAGKSKAVFMKSKAPKPGEQGGHFIIKSMSKVDRYSMLDILPEYVEYMKANPDSLMPRFFTTCKVKEDKKMLKPGRYVVMWNWDRGKLGPLSPSLLFDLKGTQENRTVAVKKGVSPAAWPTFKDNNFGGSVNGLPLPDAVYAGGNTAKRVVAALDRDTSKLAEWKLMDYSLVLRVDMVTVPEDPEDPEQDPRYQGSAALVCCQTDGGQSCPKPGTPKEKLYGPIFAEHGGWVAGMHECPTRLQPSRCAEGEKVVSLYSFGLVDVLQPWNTWKQTAEYYKMLYVSQAKRDTVEPDYYKERFMGMIRRTFRIPEAGQTSAPGEKIDVEDPYDTMCEAEVAEEHGRLRVGAGSPTVTL
jgi:hypothetical protein